MRNSCVTTKLAQSVHENALSFQSKNQRLAFSAREDVIHSHRSRELASICSHQRAAARSPSRIRIKVRVSSIT